MHSTAKNIVAAVVGFLVGSIVNFGLITVGMSIIPPPDGMDFSTMEAVRENMKSLSPQHFIFPFLGHAVGTFVGALIASKLAATHAMRFAIGIGVAF